MDEAAAELLAVIPSGCTLGEGPVWDARTQALWFTDIAEAQLLCLDWTTHRLDRYRLPERLGSFGLTADPARLVCAFARGFAFYAPQSGACEWLWTLPDDVEGIRMNDGRVDRQGRFVAGSMVEDKALAGDKRGTLYRLSCAGGVHVENLRGGIAISNSTCFAPDGSALYFADTPTREIHRYSIDGSTGIGDRGVFAAVAGPGVPDGSDVDSCGRLWNAEWGGSRVSVYDDIGTPVARLEMPVSQPTSVTFGGPDLDVLFVTSARLDLPPRQLAAEPMAGDLFVFRVAVPGLPAPIFGENACTI